MVKAVQWCMEEILIIVCWFALVAAQIGIQTGLSEFVRKKNRPVTEKKGVWEGLAKNDGIYFQDSLRNGCGKMTSSFAVLSLTLSPISCVVFHLIKNPTY
jgi:hypothetical protein